MNNANQSKNMLTRNPSIKRRQAPVVKQTKTSFKRMLNANPLMKHNLVNNELSTPMQTKPFFSTVSTTTGKSTSNVNARVALKDDKLKQKKCTSTSKQEPGPPDVISNNKAKLDISVIKGHSSRVDYISNNIRNASKNLHIKSKASVNFNTEKLLSSTRLESTRKPIQSKKSVQVERARHENETKRTKPLRRSLSAQHFDRRKGNKINSKICYNKADQSQSLEDLREAKCDIVQAPDVSPILEKNESVIFKSPSAYARRSVAPLTPSTNKRTSWFGMRCSTPGPASKDLQRRLNDWLNKRGKSLSSFHHLKCFGVHCHKPSFIEEENKENIEVEECAVDKGSYEDLKIVDEHENLSKNSPHITHDNLENVAKAALVDLHKLVLEGYPVDQCEGWLNMIRHKYKNVGNESQYWECRAAIEQARGNLSEAVECYRTAIVQGAEIKAVDESLDQLLQKFSLLNISTNEPVDNEKHLKERARIVRDARNVFKSSIIKFAVQERKLKKNDTGKTGEIKLVATPVRRSTRLSRSAFTSTPGMLICSSLKELDSPIRDTLDFQKNKALY